MSKRRILVVDDESGMQRILEVVLQDLGHDVFCAGNGEEALAIIRQEPIDLLVTDLMMPVMDGITLLKTLQQQEQSLPSIVITAHGTVETAIQAMQYGACDYILRPFEIETVELSVKRALSLIKVTAENQFLRDEVNRGWLEFVGRSAVMQQLYQLIAQAGPSGASVFIVGETGTGKELVARAIHRTSQRNGLFVAINCAAIPETILESELFGHIKGAFTGAHNSRAGKFEAADGGTLFLDEITEMPIDLQAKLLRVLQENKIERLGSNRSIDLDLRVIAATNCDPQQAVDEGRLRKDVFYRLNVIRINVPALRQRGTDIQLLAEHFIELYARRMGKPVPVLNATAITQLNAYNWPGNVRELSNLMERLLVLHTDTEINDCGLEPVSVEIQQTTAIMQDMPTLALIPQVEALEKRLIKTALQQASGNKAKAARLLEISERSLWYKIKKYQID